MSISAGFSLLVENQTRYSMFPAGPLIEEYVSPFIVYSRADIQCKTFSITILCFALSIFKFGFLKIKPIAIQRIVNRISDSYIVLDSDLTIVDFNETFLKTFHLTSSSIINKKIFDVFNKIIGN